MSHASSFFFFDEEEEEEEIITLIVRFPRDEISCRTAIYTYVASSLNRITVPMTSRIRSFSNGQKVDSCYEPCPRLVSNVQSVTMIVSLLNKF